MVVVVVVVVGSVGVGDDEVDDGVGAAAGVVGAASAFFSFAGQIPPEMHWFGGVVRQMFSCASSHARRFLLLVMRSRHFGRAFA